MHYYTTVRETKWPLQQLVAKMLENYYRALLREDVKQMESIIATLMLLLPKEERSVIKKRLKDFSFEDDRGLRDEVEVEAKYKQEYTRHLQEVIEAVMDTRTIRMVLEDVRSAEHVSY